MRKAPSDPDHMDRPKVLTVKAFRSPQYKHTTASMLVLPKEMHDILRYNVHIIYVLNPKVIYLPFNCSFDFEAREEAHSVPYLHIGCREDP